MAEPEIGHDLNDLQGLIGGHPGMTVKRRPEGILKEAQHDKDPGRMTGAAGVDLYPLNAAAMMNAARMLQIMDGSGFTPDLIDHGEGWIIESDLGKSEVVTDGELFRHNMTRLLATLRARNVRHGDLTGGNTIIRNNWPWLTDWGEAHVIGVKAPQKTPFSDSHLLWRTVAGTFDDKGQLDTPRIARRWLAVLGALGATFGLDLPLKGRTFLDLGCFQGSFVAAAAAEGMDAHGLDMGGFRSGENGIEIGRELWADFPFGRVKLAEGNIMGGQRRFDSDVTVMFSTWSYIVQTHGQAAAEQLFGRIMSGTAHFFFENQLYGDGPGPEFFQSDSDIETMLSKYGRVNHLIRIDVTGRPGKRSVWHVEPRG